MKPYLPAFLCMISIITCVTDVFSQQKPRQSNVKPTVPNAANPDPGLKVADYPYYILVTRANDWKKPEFSTFYTLKPETQLPGGAPFILLDIRTGKEVAWWYYRETSYIKSKDLLISQNMPKPFFPYHFSLYESSGKKKIEYNVTTDRNTPVMGELNLWPTGDLSKAITVFNKDLWLWDFDYLTGKSTNPRQVTQIGLLGPDPIYYFHPNAIVGVATNVHGPKRSYMVNVETGKSTAFGGEMVSNNEYPINFFLAKNENVETGLANFKNQQVIIPSKNEMKHVLFLDRNNTKSLLMGPTLENKYRFALRSPNGIVIGRETYNYRPLPPAGTAESRFFGDYKISPKGKNLILANQLEIKGKVKTVLLLIDLESLKSEIIDISTSRLHYKTFNCEWMDDENFMFVAKSGENVVDMVIDESTQGTYVYNIVTKKVKRLSPYLLDNGMGILGVRGSSYRMIRLPDSEWIVFSANNFMYKCKPDGSELTQIFQFPSLYQIEGDFLTVKPELD